MTTSDSRTSARPRARRRGAHLLSTVLFIAALGFAGAAIYLYVSDEGSTNGPPPPSAVAGRNEAANVMEGLKEAGLKPEYGRYTVTASQLTPPGQAIVVGGQELFIFIYVDEDGAAAIAEREADAADLDPATVTLTSRSAERPIGANEELHVFSNSNIIAILVGGDDKLVEKVGGVIESLP